ncbi:hypothetical protein ZIOFF_012643 [Zingiber officinale]|uniref:Serine-threonine/tyrosine-protein kinase catalytic domain-containing protein n=1 Tax=Zingiber officinale TaxID=94328 RepID=A0A8J5HQV1_ZINOF|nr:hypothetical protein ZIOFF_012643 [Zingiber officinale]
MSGSVAMLYRADPAGDGIGRTALPELLASLSTSLSSVHLAFPFLPRSTRQFVVVGALPRLAPTLPEKEFGQLGMIWAPEYAMRVYLIDKTDVYGFGVVTLEIVSGMSNTNYRPKEEFTYFLDCYIDLVHFLTFPSSEKIISVLRLCFARAWKFEAFVGLLLLRTTIVGVTWEWQARALCKLVSLIKCTL